MGENAKARGKKMIGQYGPYSFSPLGYIDWNIWTPLETAIWERFENAGIPEAIDDYADEFTPAALIPVTYLFSRNGATYDKRVAEYQQAIQEGQEVGPSYAFIFDGRTIVVDGNHRAHARILEGQTSIPVRTLVL